MRLPADHYVEIEHLRLRYWLEGESGSNLVLIHGIGGAVDVWRKQFDALARTHRVLAIDLPGCGRSAIPAVYPPDTLRLLAAAVRGVMEAVGMRSGTIIGSSLGGAVAIEFAFRWPEMTSSLVLIGPAGMTHKVAWPLRLMTVRGVGEALTLPDRTRTAQAIRQCVANPDTVAEADIDRAFGMATLPGAQDAFLRLLRTYATLTGLDRREVQRLQACMHTIHAPTLVIWGAQDRILPVSAAPTALAHLPNAGLIVRPESGHLVFVEEPEWFNATVAEFVAAPETLLARLQPQPATPLSASKHDRVWRRSPMQPRLRLTAAAVLMMLLLIGLQAARQRSG